MKTMKKALDSSLAEWTFNIAVFWTFLALLCGWSDSSLGMLIWMTLQIPFLVYYTIRDGQRALMSRKKSDES